MSDVAHHIPLTDTTGLSIASASKQFTAFAVLLLEAEGKIRLTDNIRHYVPELPEFGQPITIRELLNHTSGLRDYWNLFDMAGWRTSDVETQPDMLWLIHRQQALNHKPGAEFLYNNTGYFVLALLVERVSGTPFRRFVTERVFGPLGMTRSDIKAEMDPAIDFGALLSQFDTILVGRRTFEPMAHAGRATMPGMRTVVLSGTLRQQDFPLEPEHLLRLGEVSELNRRPSFVDATTGRSPPRAARQPWPRKSSSR